MEQKDKQTSNEATEIVLGIVSNILYHVDVANETELFYSVVITLIRMHKAGLINDLQKANSISFIFKEIEDPNSILLKYINKDQSTGLFSLRPEWRKEMKANKAQEHQRTTTLTS